MSAGKAASFALVLIALATMAVATGEYVVVAPLGAALIAALFVRLEGELAFRGYILLGIPFALLARVHPIEGTSGLGLNVPFYVALSIQLVAIRKLATRATNVGHVVFCAAAGVAAVGADCDPYHYEIFALAFLAGLTVAMRGASGAGLSVKHRARALGVAISVLLVVGLSVGASKFVEAIYEPVSQAFIRRVGHMPTPSAGGFSGAARLGDVSGLQEGDEKSEIALRAFAKFAPGYLRGKTWLDYVKGEWTAEPDGPGERPNLLPEGSSLGRLVLRGRKAPADAAEAAMRVFPSSSYPRYFFTPLRATAIDTTSEVVKVAPGGTIESPFDATSNGYSVFVGREPVTGGGWTKLPSDPVLVATLDRVLAEIGPRATRPALVQALKDWFSKKYTYKYGIAFEKGSDPLVQFLTVKQHGHCELFASAGALLLRRSGVPARYVTGFLCQEKNPSSDDLWVARNRHAHAWVEYDEGATGWETAELTPDSGMPTFQPASGLDAWLDALHGWWDRLQALVAEHGFAGLFQLTLRALGSWLAGSWPGRGLLAALLVYVLRRGRLGLPKRAPRKEARVLPPGLEAERKRYLAFERTLARRGFTRLPSETLDEFARRLEPADAERVRAYAALRYAPF